MGSALQSETNRVNAPARSAIGSVNTVSLGGGGLASVMLRTAAGARRNTVEHLGRGRFERDEVGGTNVQHEHEIEHVSRGGVEVVLREVDAASNETGVARAQRVGAGGDGERIVAPLRERLFDGWRRIPGR